MRRLALLPALILSACMESGDKEDPPPGPAPYDWSLDLDLAGDTAFQALAGDASAEGAVRGEISGRVNDLDTALVKDTLFFRNQANSIFLVDAPLDAAGAFRFPAEDLLGEMDGSLTVHIFLKARKMDRPPRPDTVRLALDRL